MEERIKEVKHLKSLLLIYSNIDDCTSVCMWKIFKNNSSVPTELWTVDNAKQAFIMRSEHKAEYEQKRINYFNSQTSQ